MLVQREEAEQEEEAEAVHASRSSDRSGHFPQSQSVIQ